MTISPSINSFNDLKTNDTTKLVNILSPSTAQKLVTKYF